MYIKHSNKENKPIPLCELDFDVMAKIIGNGYDYNGYIVVRPYNFNPEILVSLYPAVRIWSGGPIPNFNVQPLKSGESVTFTQD